jgi:hypothetical protein
MWLSGLVVLIIADGARERFMMERCHALNPASISTRMSPFNDDDPSKNSLLAANAMATGRDGATGVNSRAWSTIVSGDASLALVTTTCMLDPAVAPFFTHAASYRAHASLAASFKSSRLSSYAGGVSRRVKGLQQPRSQSRHPLRELFETESCGFLNWNTDLSSLAAEAYMRSQKSGTTKLVIAHTGRLKQALLHSNDRMVEVEERRLAEAIETMRGVIDDERDALIVVSPHARTSCSWGQGVRSASVDTRGWSDILNFKAEPVYSVWGGTWSSAAPPPPSLRSAALSNVA